MNVVRQAGALLLAALVTSRGLFAQGAVDSPATDSTVVDLRGAPAITPADQLKVLLRPVEIRYVQQESVLLPATGSIKGLDRKSTRLNSSHSQISYAVFCLKKKTK